MIVTSLLSNATVIDALHFKSRSTELTGSNPVEVARYRDEARRGARAAPEDGAKARDADQLAGRVKEGPAGVALASGAVTAGIDAYEAGTKFNTHKFWHEILYTK